MALLERGSECMLFVLALSQLPLCFVHELLLQLDLLEFGVESLAIFVESVHAVAVVGNDLLKFELIKLLKLLRGLFCLLRSHII